MSKILVVDDDTAIRNFCYDFLSKDNHQIITASRGDQALSMIPLERPELILMDVKMPGEEGLSLLKKIRAKDPHMPVVLFSAFITPELETEAFGLGAVEVISKADGSLALREKLLRVLAAKDRVMNKKPAQTGPVEKILVVDDEESIRRFLSNFFKSKGFVTLEASSGEQAVEIVKAQKPSVILLDIMMPGMDGIVTLKKIREIDSEVGVVMATGLYDENLAQEAANLGSYSYVLKPFDLKYIELVVMTRLLLAS
jgi:DNA-binding response OmpR family regulator